MPWLKAVGQNLIKARNINSNCILNIPGGFLRKLGDLLGEGRWGGHLVLHVKVKRVHANVSFRARTWKFSAYTWMFHAHTRMFRALRETYRGHAEHSRACPRWEQPCVVGGHKYLKKFIYVLFTCNRTLLMRHPNKKKKYFSGHQHYTALFV